MLRPGKKFYKRPSLVAATFVFLLALLTVPTTLVLTARAEGKSAPLKEDKPAILGKLEYVDHWSTGTGEYLARCTSLAISPDGEHIYATAYGSRCLVVFHRDMVTGYLKHLETIPWKGAFATRISPDSHYLVCTDVRSNLAHLAHFDGSNSVNLFERDQSTGTLTLLHSVKNGENGIESLDYVVDAGFSPDSRFVYVVARRSAAVTAFRITDDKKLAFVQFNKGKDQCFEGARGIAVSPDGKYLYVTSTQPGTLVALQRNPETGEIDLKQVIRDEQADIHGLAGVWDVTCSPDGKFVYTNAGGRGGGKGKDNAICAFKRMSDGTLSLVQEIRGDEGRIGLVGGSRLRVTPDGKHLYALGMNSDSIVVFQRNRKTGKLTHTQTHSCQRIGRLCLPADLVISPDGEYVYVGGEGIGLNGIILLKRLTGTELGSAEALYKAACTGDRKRLQSLIEGGTDINVRGERGYTALHWAAKENQKEAAELLLEVGADVNARTGESGWSPLHVATLQSNKDVAELLIAKRADLDAQNHNNWQTPLLITQKTGDMDFARFLLDQGAKLDMRNQRGCTPLHQAAMQGDTRFADLLIKRGANINEKAENGITALFFAIRLQDAQTIRWFISKGADINAKDNRGRTPLDYAKRMYPDIVELLRKHGAK